MIPDDPDSAARLFYLTALIVAICAATFFSQRHRLGRSLRDLGIWVLIFAMLLIAYGFRDMLTGALLPSRGIEDADGGISLRRAEDGHFHAVVEVNGVGVRFLVDTGASEVVLSQSDARRVGFDPDALIYGGRAATANGVVATAPVRLKRIEFAGRVIEDLPASVNSGALSTSLLGMTFLDQFGRIEIAGDRMRLSP